MSDPRPPSRVLLIIAGLMTQVIGVVCLIAALASLPMVHDVHGSTSTVIASVIASIGAVVCGTLVWRARLVPLALAMGIDVGFGIVLPRGNSSIGTLMRILPEGDVDTVEALVTGGSIFMFLAGILCAVAIPSALNLRRWARSVTAEIAAQPEREPQPSDTLKGFGTTRLLPTQIVRPPGTRSKWTPMIIVGAAVTSIALFVIIAAAVTDAPASSSATGSGSDVAVGSAVGSSATIDAADVVATVDADVIDVGMVVSEQKPDDLLVAFHAAISAGDKIALSQLVQPTAFAFGVEANELAETGDAIVALVQRDTGTPKSGTYEVEHTQATIGSEGDCAWIAEELLVNGKRFLVTIVAGFVDRHWTIAALHLAQAMPNETAYRLAREGNLATPDAIPNSNDESALAQAMRTAFASKPSFVEARSSRADAFNFGSARGERLLGGENIKKVFSRIAATIRLHDAVKVGTIGETCGWGVANVDFTDADKDGTEVTQTFRVLAAWIKEPAGWRIVQTQWSNAR